MIYRLKKIIFASIFPFLIVPLVLAVTVKNVLPSENAEERPDMERPTDYIVTGTFDKYSSKYIEVDGRSHSLCKNVKIFTHKNKLIHPKDIDAAEKVKLFKNSGCVRKIKVLRFAE